MGLTYSTHSHDRAFTLIREYRPHAGSEWQAIRLAANKLGISAETIRRWLRAAESINSTHAADSRHAASVSHRPFDSHTREGPPWS